MNSLSVFLDKMDWWGLLWFLLSLVAALLCVSIHELSHGFMAYCLGDPTAKNAGRLTLNPIRHTDFMGLLMMLMTHVGWAKPVPVNMRYFKKPKEGMVLTALAGPISNFLLTLFILAIGSLLYWFAPDTIMVGYLLLFLCYIAVLSTGMGIFNLIPIPPLDGSKILFSFLPDNIYRTILRYERYVIILVLVLAWTGAFPGPLDICISWILEKFCVLTRFPFWMLQYYFGI